MIDGPDGASPTGLLLIADEDNSLLSGLVAGAYAQDQLGELIQVEQVSVDDGETRIGAGDGSGLLIIPSGFQAALLDNQPVTLTLRTNPSQFILPGIIEDVTQVLLDLGFYANQLLGDEIQAIRANADNGPDDLFVAQIAVDIQHKVEVVAPKLSPPLFDLEIVEPPPEAPAPDIALLFFPGICLMALLFAANGLAADFWVERQCGALRRLVSAPGQLMRFVAGKALGASAIIFAIAATTLVVGFAYHDVDWMKFLPSLAWLVVAGVGFFAWFAALSMLFPNQKIANLATTIIVFPLLMAGGSFFPLDAMPNWIAALGRLSPNGFVADRLTSELTSASSWAFSARDWIIVVAIMVAGLLLCTWRLGSGFARR
jgi:ABC-type transport system involved in cytochrome c biogenesis permease component